MNKVIWTKLWYSVIFVHDYSHDVRLSCDVAADGVVVHWPDLYPGSVSSLLTQWRCGSGRECLFVSMCSMWLTGDQFRLCSRPQWRKHLFLTVHVYENTSMHTVGLGFCIKHALTWKWGPAILFLQLFWEKSEFFLLNSWLFCNFIRLQRSNFILFFFFFYPDIPLLLTCLSILITLQLYAYSLKRWDFILSTFRHFSNINLAL